MDLVDVVKAFEGKKVLVIGDSMLDKYEIGESIIPYEGKSIIKSKEVKYYPGGAANVASNLKSLGAIPYLLTYIGSDSYGKILLNEIKNRKIIHDLIFYGDFNNYAHELTKHEHNLTTVKTRVIEVKNGVQNQLLRYDNDVQLDNPIKQEKRIDKRFFQSLDAVDGVIFEDYQKGFLPNALTQRLIDISNKCNKPVFVDPKNEFKKFQGATIFKPNKRELYHMTGYAATLFACDFVHRIIKPKHLVLTAGREGMYLFRNNDLINFPAKIINEEHIVGAGDTVIASLALSYLSGASIEDSIKIANHAASIALRKPYTSQPNLEELLSELKPS